MNSVKSKTMLMAAAGLLVSGLLMQPVLAAGGGKSSKKATARADFVTNCDNLNKRRLKTSTPPADITTTSTSFVDIVGTGVRIIVSATSCVVVTFSARARAVDLAGNEGMFVRALLDGVTVGRPSDGDDVAFTANDNIGLFDAHSFTWLFPAVAAGTHVVNLQFRSATGDVVEIYQHTVDVSFR